MTPSEFERLRSWMPEIAVALFPSGTKFTDEGDERRFLGQGGFSINRRRGLWYSFNGGKGGRSATSLIAFIKGCGEAEAVEWANAWLGSHPGTGETGIADDPDDVGHHCASAAEAREILKRLVDPSGTPAEAYLRERSITGPLPECVRFLPNARVGEGAIAAILTVRGRIVGVQLGYLDSDGRKSTVNPHRRRFMLNGVPDAVFEAGGSGDDLIVCEGLEDALSVATLGRPSRVLGLPGIGILRNIRTDKGARVVVVRDGDEAGSAADQALHAGLDELILQAADVDVTVTPKGQDANSILCDGGPEALSRLIDNAAPAELSRDGQIRQAAALDPLVYDFNRKKIAAKLGIRVGTLDEQVKTARCEARIGHNHASADLEEELADEPVDLAETLDAILIELRRYIVASDVLLATVALWAAHTHLVHHDRVRLDVSPRLAIQARDVGCGKTVLLEAVSGLVHNPRTASSVTAATVLRVFDVAKPTLLVDEADQLLRTGHNPELLAILNASHRRSTAFVERAVPRPTAAGLSSGFPCGARSRWPASASCRGSSRTARSSSL